MPTVVTYAGPEDPADTARGFRIRDENGEMHVLRKGVPTEIPTKLANELVKGEGRIAGYKFETTPDAAVPGGPITGDYDSHTSDDLSAELVRRGLPDEANKPAKVAALEANDETTGGDS